MFWMVGITAAWAGTVLPCGTPQHMTEFAGVEIAISAPPSSDLTDQESHGSIPNVRYSDRFALKWGPSVDLSDADATRLLNDFDYALSEMVYGWEMPDPTGVGGTFFNVYIGDSGGVVPSVFGAAGYYTTDSFGYPMIVLNKDILGDASYVRSVIAHEFFHGIQGATSAYRNWETASWYWEATATWAAGEAVPESGTYASFLVFYAAQPHMGLYHFSADEYGGAPPDYHQYGAFIFPRFLSEFMEGAEAVRESWRAGDSDGDPVVFLRDYMTPLLFDAAFLDHAAHSLLWDYGDGENYRYWVEGLAGNWPDRDFRTSSLTAFDDEWYVSAEGLQLAQSSYTVVPVPSGWSDDGLLTVRIETDGPPSSDCEPSFAGRIVRVQDGEPTYIALSTTAVHDTATVGTAGDLWLVVANVATLDTCDGSIPFKVSFVRRDDPPPDPTEPTDTADPDTGLDTGMDGPVADSGADTGKHSSGEPVRPSVDARSSSAKDAGGCSCASGPSKLSLTWALLIGHLVMLRRRPTQRE